MYSGRPKLAANDKTPFCKKAVASDVKATMVSRKAKYCSGGASRKVDVETVRKAKTTVLTHSARFIRKGYEAERCILVRINITARLVIVEAVIMADWKLR